MHNLSQHEGPERRLEVDTMLIGETLMYDPQMSKHT